MIVVKKHGPQHAISSEGEGGSKLKLFLKNYENEEKNFGF